MYLYMKYMKLNEFFGFSELSSGEFSYFSFQLQYPRIVLNHRRYTKHNGPTLPHYILCTSRVLFHIHLYTILCSCIHIEMLSMLCVQCAHFHIDLLPFYDNEQEIKKILHVC